MSNFLKNSVTGLDIPIQGFQKYLYSSLRKIWKVDESNFDGYGRVYKNTNDKGVVPEIFEGSTEPNNTEYKALYFDKNTKKALFFFFTDDQEIYKDGSATVKVYLTFIVNLATLKPDLPHRSDEEVRNEVRKICSQGLFELTFTGSETGFKNVFKQFNGLVNKDGEVFEDRHPIFCFKMNFSLAYQPAEIQC